MLNVQMSQYGRPQPCTISIEERHARLAKARLASGKKRKINWRTGEHGDALLYKKNHKFGGKSPSSIPAIAHRSNTHKLHRQDAADPGPAAAVAAAALPTARAGPLGRRRRREPRTGPGASAPGDRAGSGGYDEGAAAFVAAALPTARAGPPGRRRCPEPRTGPAASARAPA
jgi:hypothetical protein